MISQNLVFVLFLTKLSYLSSNRVHAVIVLVIIQLSDHKSFWLRRFDTRQRLTHHFFNMANIAYEYYSLFLYLYSYEVRNNDFCAFPFLSNQTMHVLIV